MWPGMEVGLALNKMDVVSNINVAQGSSRGGDVHFMDLRVVRAKQQGDPDQTGLPQIKMAAQRR